LDEEKLDSLRKYFIKVQGIEEEPAVVKWREEIEFDYESD